MKLTCTQSDLARGLTTVGHAVSTRSTLPILANVLLATEGERLRLSATNLEIGITCWIPARVQDEGTTTIPARLISEFVATLPSGEVTLDLPADGGQSLKVKGLRSQATIRGMDPGEFPTIPTTEGNATRVSLDAKELKAMIREVSFAAAADDTRPVFTGVLARVRDGKLTFAAADSFRLAVRSAALPGQEDAASLGDVLIPARTLTELARILPEEGIVRMEVTPNRNQVVFRAGDEVELVSNLIAGQFPNFEAILPKSSTTHVTIDTDTFRQAARTASIFARDSANIVRIKVEKGEHEGLTPDAITIEATAEESGDSTTTLDAKVEGPGLEIIFNVKYLTDVLAVLDTPQTALELNSPQHPGVIKSLGGAASDYVYVIMPMHSTR